ncbi:hypothetical protein ACX0G9_06010 [Flavitalea flava]
MQKLLLLVSLLLVSLVACQQLAAQLPEDALRASWTTPSGTAREQAIGGAMGSLGGEISSGFVNPAGLGIYKTNEFVISPGFRFLMDKSTYLGTKTSGNSVTNYNMGTTGLVYSYQGGNGGHNVFAIAVNRMANFNSNIYYKGQNSQSSGSEQYAQEYAASGLDVRQVDQNIANPGLTYGTRMALYTSLVDTLTAGGEMFVVGQPSKGSSFLLNQENNLRTSGGITEIALSVATTARDKWYFGGTLGIPILSYTRTQTYFESDASGNTNNDFDSYTYKETYSSKGWGLNAKLGVLYRPNNSWRFGLAVHTPSMFGITDKIHSSMVTRTENLTSYKQVSISSDTLDMLSNINPVNSVNYNLYTPWKFLFSTSYVFGGGSANVKQQKGFVTADIEYITTGSPRFRTADNGDGSDNSYYDAVNQAIKNSYKGTLGARFGGELKLSTFMARAGVAYYSNPYEGSVLKADRLFLSGGLGYRNKGMFIDLTYIQAFNRDVNFPYILADTKNEYASLKESGGTVMLTVGFKF